MQMHVRKTCSLGCWAESERLKWRRKDSHLQIITNVILYGFTLDVFLVVHVFWEGSASLKASASLKGSPSPKRIINFGNPPTLNNPTDNPIQSLVDGWWWGSACISSRSSNMTWRCAMEEMKRTLSKFQSKRHFVWREFHLQKKSFQSFYASFLGMNIVTSWLNVEVRGVLLFGFHMANNGWHLDGRPSTRCSKRRTWAKHWRTLSWCISTGKQWFALHISGHLLLLSLELLFGWFEKMVWKLPKWRFFVVRFVCVLRQEQRSKLHHCCCQRAWGQRFAFQKPQTGNIRSFLHSEKSHFQGVWGALCVCVFWWIFKGSIFALSMCHPFRFWLHRTRCFCPAITWHEREKWQLRSLEIKHVGSWWGWMDEYTSWVQHREDTGHHDNHDYHEHVWSIRMLQDFYPRCFGVLNIWVSFWRKRQTTKSVSSRMCSRAQPKAFVGFKATISSYPSGNGKIVSRTTWLWDCACSL